MGAEGGDVVTQRNYGIFLVEGGRGVEAADMLRLAVAQGVIISTLLILLPLLIRLTRLTLLTHSLFKRTLTPLNVRSLNP
jgi:hypothetical protein